MVRRPTHDKSGKILPFRVRQPVAFWVVMLVSVGMIVSLLGSALLLLL
jgi:hypothetical protein